MGMIGKTPDWLWKPYVYGIWIPLQWIKRKIKGIFYKEPEADYSPSEEEFTGE